MDDEVEVKVPKKEENLKENKILEDELLNKKYDKTILTSLKDNSSNYFLCFLNNSAIRIFKKISI